MRLYVNFVIDSGLFFANGLPTSTRIFRITVSLEIFAEWSGFFSRTRNAHEITFLETVILHVRRFARFGTISPILKTCNTHRGVLLLVKLQSKVTLFYGCFPVFKILQIAPNRAKQHKLDQVVEFRLQNKWLWVRVPLPSLEIRCNIWVDWKGRISYHESITFTFRNKKASRTEPSREISEFSWSTGT